MMKRRLMVLIVILGLGAAIGAQTAVTAADLARLDAAAAEIRARVTTLKNTDATLASEVERSLGDLTDEIAYLRVKMRREGTVSREEYAALRDRLETLRMRASGTSTVSRDAAGTPALRAGTLAVGTQLGVRLQTALNSGTSRVEERFEGTTVLDVTQDGALLVPAGSIVRGFVSSVRAAGRIDRRGSLTLSFDEIRINDRSQRLRASVIQATDGRLSDDTKRIGAGAVVGAILGGVLGGGKGAVIGVLVGGGGTIAATDGTDLDFPPGTVLTIRLDEPLVLAGS